MVRGLPSLPSPRGGGLQLCPQGLLGWRVWLPRLTSPELVTSVLRCVRPCPRDASPGDGGLLGPG
eukprot:7804268-Alexandrium_andersonii.AAC.1